MDSGTNQTSKGFITLLSPPATVTNGTTVVINSTFRNIGTIRDRVTMKIYHNNLLVGYVITTLDPGREVPFNVSWTPTVRGTHTIKGECYGRANGIDHLDATLTRTSHVV